MSQRVLVTGGTGLIGSAIQQVVAETNTGAEWFFIGTKDADLRDAEQTNQLFEKLKPTKVIHLAARVGGLYRNLKQNVEMFQENVAINNNILSACHTHNVTKVVSMLSTCIFPDKIEHYPFDESVIHNGKPHPSNEGYAFAKRMLEVQSRLFHNQYSDQCTYVCVVPTNVFGPNDNFNLEDGHVLPALIHKAYLAKESSQPLCVFGSGRPLRQFIYSLDLAKLLLWALDHYEDAQEPVMLCTDPEDEVSIKTVAELIYEKMGCSSELHFDPSKADGQFKKTASNAKLRRLYPDFQFTPIEKAIEETCIWFRDNFEHSRR